MGAYATADGEHLRLRAFVSNIEGDVYLEDTRMGTDAVALGQTAAQTLIDKGAADILKNLQI